MSRPPIKMKENKRTVQQQMGFNNYSLDPTKQGQHSLDVKNMAAVKIQSLGRGFLTRKTFRLFRLFKMQKQKGVTMQLVRKIEDSQNFNVRYIERRLGDIQFFAQNRSVSRQSSTKSSQAKKLRMSQSQEA
jgi:hypothetical protein